MEKQSDMAVSRKSLVVTAGSLLSGLMLLAISQPAQAFTFYTGSSPIVTGALPTAPYGGAGTARDSFVTAASADGTAAGVGGTVQLQDFETPAGNNNFYGGTGDGSVTVGNATIGTTTVAVNDGRIGTQNPDNGINNNPGDLTAGGLGWNTTPGGRRFLRIAQPTSTTGTPLQTSFTLSFGAPLRSFGVFITDYGNTANAATTLTASINGGSTQTISKLGFSAAGDNHSVQFFGFTPQAGDPLITSITFQFTGLTTQIDRMALDDIRYVKVPVPPQLIGTCLAAALGAWKTRRSLKLKAKQA
jgi:hypothetical protein